MEIKNKINEYKLDGDSSIVEIMSLWNADDALEKLKYSLECMRKQNRIIKKRLFVIIATGQFDIIHSKLSKHSKRFMKYKWQKYNTVLKVKQIYDACTNYLNALNVNDLEVINNLFQ